MTLIWIGFVVFILLLLALDLGVIHRSAHIMKTREALIWSAVWLGVALAFGVFVYFGYEHHWLGMGSHPDAVDGRVNDGTSATIKYFTGYVVEKSLSVDNLFVIAVIFSSLAVPAFAQPRVLLWGVLGALVLRGAMIGAGGELVRRYHWTLYIFGGFLLITAVKLLFAGDSPKDVSDSRLLKWTRKVLPVSDHYVGASFSTRLRGRWMLTPLAPAVILVEATDAVFAVDSIPAIFAITADPFLVFTSNVFALLGLRALFFALAGMMERFRYLKVSLSLVLAVVGGKMLAGHWLIDRLGPWANLYLLGLIAVILAGGLIASLRTTRPAHDTARRQPTIAAS